MTRSQMKADYEHVLIKLLKAEVSDNIDVTIRPAYLNCDIHALVIEPKSHLKYVSIVHEDEMLVFQQHEVGLGRNLSHYYFHCINKKKVMLPIQFNRARRF